MSPSSFQLADDRAETRIPQDEKPWTVSEALVEAARCLYCFKAPCAKACPAGVDVPEFIRSLRTGALKSAARLVLSANALAETCGVVCPTEILCVGECVLPYLDGQKPIAIHRLQRFAASWARQSELRLFEPGKPTGKQVALVGGGPASLAAGHELTRFGHKAVIFESSDVPGGMNTGAIAPHKMHADLPLAELAWLLGMGIELRTLTAVGRDITFEEIEKAFDAVFIGVGLGPDQKIGIPGEDAKDVVGAIELLRGLKTGRIGVPLPWKQVLVVGGGNSAIDAARTLKDLGVPEVALVYRRTEEHMKGYAHEWKDARLAGVEARFMTQPLEILLRNGKVAGLSCLRMTPGEIDESGRPKPVPVPGSEFEIEGDAVVFATGQLGPKELLPGLPGDIRIAGQRIDVCPETGATSRPGYYAGGDCANGGKEVVNAAAEGLRAARAIDRYLQKN